MCTDDSKFIYAVSIRDFSTSTLQDFVTHVCEETLQLKPGYVIEFQESILYDSTQDLEDEDEAEMYQRRLKKALSTLKIKDLSKLLVQGTFPDSSTDSQIYFEIVHDAHLT